MMKKISLTSDHGAAEVGQSQNVNDPGAFWLHQILQHQEAQELQFFLHFLSAGETAAAFQRDPSYHALQLQQSETQTGSHRSMVPRSVRSSTGLQARARTLRPSLEKLRSLLENCCGTENDEMNE